MNYNYVFFNTAGSKRIIIDKNDYYTICTRDLENQPGICLVNYPLDNRSIFLRTLFAIHNSRAINSVVKIPFKELWYKYYFTNQFENNKPICFIVSGRYISIEYIRFLKQTYPKCRIVKLYRDIKRVSRETLPEFTDEICNELFDLQMSEDFEEAAENGYIYFHEFESKIEIAHADKYPLYDIFFAGAGKDRLPVLMDIYNTCRLNGLNCRYYLIRVPKENRIPYEGITYADKQMPYTEMLYNTVNSRCVLEINRQGGYSYTSRFLEAVMYNKKLITNNPYVKNSPMYNEKYIRIIKDASEFDVSFVKADSMKIDYGYNNEFSPINLILQIDELLSKE